MADRFRIDHALGQGGMGQVFEATDLELGESVALKVIRPEVAVRPDAVARFKREVQLARQVTHPNVCRVFDLVQHGRDGGSGRLPRPVLFLTMELVRGETLAEVIRRRGALSPKESIPLIRQMLAALEAAHRVGVVHRDFKTANVMLTPGLEGAPRCVVTDFGLAQVFEPPMAPDSAVGPEETRPASTPCGTPSYMSPEQHATGKAFEQSDLYALGVVAFEMLTGRRPFEAASTADLARLHREQAPPPLGDYVPDADPGLEHWILRCLEKDPRRRPASAAEAARALCAWRPAQGRSLPSRPHWYLEKKLGEGGFGEVWLVRHRKTGASRTLKFCYDANRLTALKREVTLLRLLEEKLGPRDDFPRILDWNLDEEPFFIESEHTEGCDLAAWAEGQGGLGEIPLSKRLDLVARLAEALSAAHSAGVIHQDVKPANVLVYDDDSGRPRVRLNDFGSGRVGDRAILEATEVTVLGMTASTGSLLDGTLRYMAPEVLEGREPTTQADVYALGVLLYQVIAGDFSRALAPGWRREVNDELLAEDIAMAVDGDPENRASARELAERLRTLDRRRVEQREARQRIAETERLRRALARARQRWRRWAVVTGVVLLFAVAMGLLSRRANREARRARDVARLAVADEWLEKDPTRAALVLLEVEETTAEVLGKMQTVLGYPIALREFRGHTARVHQVAFSPDGRKIATASYDGTSRLWTVDGSGMPTVFRGHETMVNFVAWSPQGDRVATVAHDGTARVWNADGSGQAIVLRGHEDDAVWTVFFHPEGDRVVTSSHDRTARIWTLDGSGETVVLRGHEGWVFSAMFSPDGQRVVTASQDGTARVWNVDGSGEPVELQGHESWLFSAVFSPDGKRVVTASRDSTARVWNADGTGLSTVFRERTGTLYAALFSPDGKRILTAAEDGTVRLWNMDGSGAKVLCHGPSGRTRAHFSPDGHRVVASFNDGRVRILDADGMAPAATLRGQGDVYGAGFSPDSQLVATPSEDGTVRLWDVSAPPENLVFRGHQGPVTSLALSPDGRRIASGSADHTVRVWNADGSGEPKILEGHEGMIRALAFDLSGTKLASASNDDTVRVCWLETGPCRVLRGHENSVLGVAFRQDGKLMTTSHDNLIRFWSPDDPATPLEHAVPFSHDAIRRWWVMAPDGRAVASIGDDGARIWNVANTPFASRGEPTVLRVEDLDQSRDETMRDVVFSHDSKHLLVVGSHGTVQAWTFDLGGERSPQLVRVFEGRRTRISAATFSADNRHIATAWWDGSIRVQRFDGSGEGIVLEGHDGPVLATVFSTDGRYLFTASKDRTLRRWRLDDGDVRARLRSATTVCLDPLFRESQLGERPELARRRYEACERSHGRGRPRS